MAESSQSFFKKHFEGYKEFWGERFSFLDNYARFVKRDNLLPPWSPADVDEFIASDPVHGPSLKTAREAGNFCLTGSLIGAVSTAGAAWKYSKSLHGAALSFVAGGAFGWTFLERKLQITGCNSTGLILWVHKLNSWSGGRRNLKGGHKSKCNMKEPWYSFH